MFGKQKQKTETIQKSKLNAMKTTDNAQKTENKKFGNSISKTFAVILSLVLISFTVSANGFWKQLLINNAYGKMAILMLDQENEAAHVYSSAAPSTHSIEAIGASDLFFTDVAKDKNLVIENWMIANANFNASVFADQPGADKPMNIESWMIENPGFEANGISTENEPALKVEPWMTDNTLWPNN